MLNWSVLRGILFCVFHLVLVEPAHIVQYKEYPPENEKFKSNSKGPTVLHFFCNTVLNQSWDSFVFKENL